MVELSPSARPRVAIPALIRGINRASSLNHSCPVTVIAAKLDRLLGSSNDVRLLTFARDEMEAASQSSFHRVVVQNLRFAVTQRRNALQRLELREYVLM